MDNYYTPGKTVQKKSKSWLIGIPFFIVGAVLLLDQMFYMPDWLFQWEMIVILVGVVIGLRDGFRNFTWLIIN